MLDALAQAPALQDIAARFESIFLHAVVPRLIAYAAVLVLVAWGTRRFIPRIVNAYGMEFFAWEKRWRPGRLMRWFAYAVQMSFVGWMGRDAAYEAWPFLAFIAIALHGVVQADARMQIIPDRFQMLGCAGALGYVLTAGVIPLEALWFHVGMGLGIAAVLLLLTKAYDRLRGKDGLGLGDIKLLAWLGIVFGPGTLLIILYGMGAAVLVMVPAVLMRLRRSDASFAFGPYLVLGVLLQASNI